MTSPIRGARVGESVSTFRSPGPQSDATTRFERNATMALSRTILRMGAALTLAATLALSIGGAALAAVPPTTTDPGAAAAGWLAAQVDAGITPGNLADSIFAFASVGAGGDAAASALAKLEAGVDGYILDGSDLVPGYVAKTLLAVEVAGGDPTSFGGHDLEAELRGLMITTAGPDLGRFGAALPSDQALAIIALARTSGGVPKDAVDYLVSVQCPDGDFNWDGTCPGAGSEDPDTTGLALQGLLAGGATAAADASTQLLLSIQGSDGAFSSFGTPNTNSSGVAGQALRAAGKTSAANDAATFIKTLQYGCEAAAADRGAFPWATSYAGQLIFSTPQAVLAFGGPGLDQLSIDGASAAAPVLDCPAAPAPSATPKPTDGGGAGPVVTLPPTDLAKSPPVSGEGPWAPLALLVLAAIAGAGLATARLRARR
jgi:hypothetical protein